MRHAFGLLLFLPCALQAQDFAALKARAEAGDIVAEVAVGNAYDSGQGVTANQNEAIAWYQKAAEHGNAEAQNSLGVKYRLGEGVPKDLDIAVQWYRAAAKNGNPNAMFNLGAAGAMYRLGNLYLKGSAGAQDKLEAYSLFWLASETSPAAKQQLELLQAQLTEKEQKRAKDKAKHIYEKAALSKCAWRD
jgi:TPR repeat protein